MKKSQALVTAALSALGMAAGASAANAQTAPPPTVTTAWNGAPETREEDRRFHVNGRFQYDLAYTNTDCTNTKCTSVNESGIRSYAQRIFLKVDGRLTTN